MSDRKCEPPAIKLDVMMNNTRRIVELDTGASATVINESNVPPDQAQTDLLRTYSRKGSSAWHSEDNHKVPGPHTNTSFRPTDSNGSASKYSWR